MKISLKLKEADGINRVEELMTLGFPLPKSAFHKEDSLSVKEGSEYVKTQTSPLSYWPDGSIKWLLVDFPYTLRSEEEKNLEFSNDSSIVTNEYPYSIKIQNTQEKWSIHTGKAQFKLDLGQQGVLSSIQISGESEVRFKNSRWVLIDEFNEKHFAQVQKSYLETEGLLRSTLRMEGCFPSLKNPDKGKFLMKMTFWAGSTSCKVEWTLWNAERAQHRKGVWDLGDSGSLMFKSQYFKLECEERSFTHVLVTRDKKEPLTQGACSRGSIYQESSGGENYLSHNHVNQRGEVPHDLPGYKLLIDSKEEEGKRIEPAVVLSEHDLSVGIALDSFWQNFPKSFDWSENKFKLSFFPEVYPSLFELQGGERKTHRFYLIFNTQENKEQIATKLRSFLNPVNFSYDSKEWMGSDVSPNFNGSDADYKKYIHQSVNGNNGLLNRRELIDEYGWRNFGELYSDHESVNQEEPFVSHFNNQYDAILGFINQFILSGDSQWWVLARDLAQHVMDIDIYHTEKDKSAYNGGLFWHTEHYRDAGLSTHRTYTNKPLVGGKGKSLGGGPSNEHNYTSGLLNYYYLSGDLNAKEAVLELANWVVNMEDGKKSVFRFIDSSDTGLSSNTSSPLFHGPGRGSGNSINALLDAFQLTQDMKYMSAVEKIILRCVHPKEKIDRLHLDEPEFRWSYLVFLQMLTKYLDFKVENKQSDFMFHYARESLLHYAEWMVNNEKPYSKLKDKLVIWSETWSAQDIRKSYVLNMAAKYSHATQRALYLNKAKYFYKKCLEDLLNQKTFYFIRPLTILLAYGCFKPFDEKELSNISFPDSNENYGEPKSFTPQKAKVKKKLLLVGGLILILLIIYKGNQYL